jgi:Na+:H+ antiporter
VACGARQVERLAEERAAAEEGDILLRPIVVTHSPSQRPQSHAFAPREDAAGAYPGAHQAGRRQPATLNPLAEGGQFGVAMLLTGVAVASKLAAGLAVYQRGVRRWPVAVGMVPRGEVGLIFAGAGLAAGVIAEDLYSALIVVVMLTTFAAPPWLKVLYRESA